MDAIIFIESNTTGTGNIIARKAIERGLKPIFLIADSSKYEFINDFEFFCVDTSSFQNVIDLIEMIRRVENIIGIMTTSEFFLYTASRICETLGYPSLNSDSIALCRNKSEFRYFSNKNDLENIVSLKIEHSQNIQELSNTIGFPLVIKPIAGSGSVNVYYCQDIQDLNRAIEIIGNSDDRGLLENYLLEEYIDGNEYSVECFNGIIIAITMKHLGEKPSFVEIGHDINVPVKSEVEAAIRSKIMKLLNLIDLSWGPIHIEGRIHDSLFKIIEVNPRLAGGMIPLALEYSTGVDFLNLWIDLVIGKNASFNPKSQESSYIRFLHSNKDQVISANYNSLIEKAMSDLSGSNLKLIDHSLYRKHGERTKPTGSFKDRHGHIILLGKQGQSGIASNIANEIMGELYEQ